MAPRSSSSSSSSFKLLLLAGCLLWHYQHQSVNALSRSSSTAPIPNHQHPNPFEAEPTTRTKNGPSVASFVLTPRKDRNDFVVDSSHAATAVDSVPAEIHNAHQDNKKQANFRFLVPSIRMSKKTQFMISLMAMSGIVEAICLRRFKVFPNMMTGNTVRCMDALAEMKWNKVLLYSGMIASYVSGSALYKFLDTAEVFPPNKKLPNLVWLSRITLGIFCVSDFLGLYRDTLRLIPLAIAFGMINTATQEAIGAVTNAATGHYGKIGFGLGEVLAMKRRLQTSADPNNNNNSNQSSATTQAAITSMQGIIVFALSLLSTHLLCGWLETKQPWILPQLPPLGISLGIAYSILLSWYSRETATMTY